MDDINFFFFLILVFIGKLVNKTAENTINGEPDPNADTNYVVQVLTIYEGVSILGLIMRLVGLQSVQPIMYFSNHN